MSEDIKMPKTEDKTACETCGEMVTTHKGGRASHMRKHAKDTLIAPEAQKAVVKTGEVQTTQQATIAKALEAQERFAKAPEVFLSEDTSDGNAALVRMYAPECIDKYNHIGKLLERAARKAFFSSEKNLDRWASRGYIPKLGSNGKYVTNDGGDILTTCDRAMSDAREKRSQMESRNIVRSAEKDLSTMSVTGAEGSTNADLKATSLEVTREEIEV